MDGNRVFGRSPVLLGHRGCGRGTVNGHQENTLGSFLAAVDAGVDWVEVDVRRTSDDQLVVVHNPAGPDGVFYADITAREAAARGALRLEALLAALPDSVGVDFDVKTSMEDATRDRAATTMGRLASIAVREARRREVLVTSFDPGALDIARQLAPGVARGLLTWVDFPIGHAVAAAGHLDVQVLAPHWGSLRPNDKEPKALQRPLDYVVDLVHESGREFLAWCPGVKFAQRLLDAGVDALCVNDVPTVVASLLAAPARS
ncbi:glycerophosphodiester phosphodiesterase [Amycolatopsis rhizosphaerae]|uniref:Glycerophosphodiester phosphodiesterase n=1 Tax=Amycolatopsis rhizosphaerae TaxID=2053003 RepID=A0A558DGB1_9PSEU|nr:glycerophosphodiester phosphodiesterase [Amycolatopsis rhizosphaerae]TVT60071.1 glycerophosphodiester phosphodiesterase [Amycolatopsis rhizosphaerae]